MTNPTSHGNPAASMPSTADDVSFPRLNARTARFTLGEPRNVTVTPDGSTVLFLRTASGVDRTGALWAFDVATATERVLADPAQLMGGSNEHLPAAERARRERSRESGAGIVSYTVDTAGCTAVFALSGELWICNIAMAECRAIHTAGAVIDPRVDPTGRHIAYASGGALRVVTVAGTDDRALAEPDGDEIVWGQAEFIAAEEMDRYRGFWWAPDGLSLLSERYDNSSMQTWYIADPAYPDRQPVAHRYPSAGSPNAEVGLWHVPLDGAKHEISWDTAKFPYLATVSWTAGGALMQVVNRLQSQTHTYRIVIDTDSVAVDLALDRSEDQWIDLVGGLPALTPDGRMLTDSVDAADGTDSSDRLRLALDGAPISPSDVQLRRVLSVHDTGVLATVSADPTEQQVLFVGYDGSIRRVSDGPGVHSGAMGGDTIVVARSSLDAVATSMTVFAAGQPVGTLANLAEKAPFTPKITMLTVGERALNVAVLLPRNHVPGSRRLPVIMAPYGGPHAQLVRASARMFLQAGWLADQGFAVVVADGRGTPGRSPAWEHEIAYELASVTLADQVDALAGVVAQYPDDLDTSRVGIMGWSYGGYLSALAVLDRPDVFHAAVAGAPVTDWTLYDTCYTERYLGLPQERPDVYERNSLIGRAAKLTRPLMLIHGTVDDNVVVAHTLRLSAALLAAGKAHEVLPLTGITHMASDEVIAENLLLAQVEFFRRTLG
ncbi:MAG: prolyl oligopeptidase family serine peptidase [Nakamurella sp.]